MYIFFFITSPNLLYKLTVYHKIPTFTNPEYETFWKQIGNKKKCCQLAFSRFLEMFSTLSKTGVANLATYELLSTISLHLNQSKTWSVGNE